VACAVWYVAIVASCTKHPTPDVPVAAPEVPVVAPSSYTYRNTEIHCIRDIPEGTTATLQGFARDAIDVLASPIFEQRALTVLRSRYVKHGTREAVEIQRLAPEEMLKRVRDASSRGFSLFSKPAGSELTNAWDGYDDPQCGRVVVLNRNKLTTRPAYLWAGTIVHELNHVAGFFHNGQRRSGNECTLPHLLGDVAEWTAWDLTHAASAESERYTTYETVCTALADACRADATRGCVISRGETP
jgi:hypothetical protein